MKANRVKGVQTEQALLSWKQNKQERTLKEKRVMDQPREKVSWKFGPSRTTFECAEFKGHKQVIKIKSRLSRSG